MSYILDALKKAERERGIAKVPTLSSVHDLRTKRPVRLWAASAIVFLCIVAFFGLFFFGLNRGSNKATPSLPEKGDDAAVQPVPEPLNTPAPADEMPSSNPLSVSSASPGLEHSQEIPARADEAGKEPIGDTGQAPFTAGNQMVQSDRAAAIPRPGDFTAGNPPRERAGKQPSSPGIAAPLAPEPKPAGEDAGEKRATLREAMDEMTMSILFYSENKADRLVFINGRKYVEGDTIDGCCLLESITPEGAVLSREGERAILRPERN